MNHGLVLFQIRLASIAFIINLSQKYFKTLITI